MAINIVKPDSVRNQPFYKPPSTLTGRLGSEEELIQRQQLARDLAVQQQAAQRQLAAQQAKMGVRGGAAQAQQTRLAQQLEQQRNVGEEQGLLGRTMFNIEQTQKEKFAELAQKLAREQIAASLEGQRLMAEAAAKGQVQAAQVGKDDRSFWQKLSPCVVIATIETSLLCFVPKAEAQFIIEESKSNLNKVLNIYKNKPEVISSIHQLEVARQMRDELNLTDLRGYYILSEKIGDTIPRSKFFNKWIGKPIILKAVLEKNDNTLLSKSFKKLFSFFGTDKPFTRKNGEVV